MSRRKKRRGTTNLRLIDERWPNAPEWMAPLLYEERVDVDKEIGEWASFWHEWEAENRRIIALSREAMPGVAVELREYVKRRRAEAHATLRTRFGLDLDPAEAGWQTVSLPGSLSEWHAFRNLLQEFQYWDIQLVTLDQMLQRVPEEETGRVAVLVLAVARRALAPTSLHADMQSLLPTERVHGTIGVTGLLRSMISMNNRLARVIASETLEDGGRARERTLRALLPGAVIRALAGQRVSPWVHEARRGHRKAVVADLIAGVMEQGRRTTKTTVVGEPDIAGEGGATLPLEEVFAASEEAFAQEQRAIMQQAGLTEREIAVFELEVQQYKESEIAEQLSITVGSVKTLKSRARRRLRAYLRPAG